MEDSLSSFLLSPQVNAPEALALLEAEGITELRDLALIGETHLSSLGVRLGPRLRILRVYAERFPPSPSGANHAAAAAATAAATASNCRQCQRHHWHQCQTCSKVHCAQHTESRTQ